jgi:hypothetical protein
MPEVRRKYDCGVRGGGCKDLSVRRARSLGGPGYGRQRSYAGAWGGPWPYREGTRPRLPASADENTELRWSVMSSSDPWSCR